MPISERAAIARLKKLPANQLTMFVGVERIKAKRLTSGTRNGKLITIPKGTIGYATKFSRTEMTATFDKLGTWGVKRKDFIEGAMKSHPA